MLRVLAHRRVRLKRKEDEENGFEKWYPTELASRHHKAVERERRRLINCQQTVHDKEIAAIADLRRHFRTKNGKLQIRCALRRKKKGNVRRNAVVRIDPLHMPNLEPKKRTSWFPQIFGAPKLGAQQVKDDLIQQCSTLMRTMGTHDFNARSPPTYKCILPHCSTYFVSEDQYRTHLERPSNHKPCDPDMASFHVLLKSLKTQELLRKHFGVHYGINTQVNCLDLWTCIQDWRRKTIKTESYVHKAGQFYEAHVRPGCPRPANIHFDEIHELHEKMKIVLRREYEGFYKLSTMDSGTLRRLFGFSGKVFEEWTVENIIPAELFNLLEYHCFCKLFMLYKQQSFQESEEGKVMAQLKEEERKAHRDADFLLYQTLRKENFRNWVVDFKINENHLEMEAFEKSTELYNTLSNEFFEALLEDEVKKESSLRGYNEQINHEESCLLSDDAANWAEVVVLEDVFTFYAETLIKTMWEKPDCRKSLMEFAGFLEKKKRVDWSKRKSVAVDWFQDFLNDAVEEEKSHYGLDVDSAATRIQKIARGRIYKRQVKRVFVNTFGKRYTLHGLIVTLCCNFFLLLLDLINHQARIITSMCILEKLHGKDHCLRSDYCLKHLPGSNNDYNNIVIFVHVQ